MDVRTHSAEVDVDLQPNDDELSGTGRPVRILHLSDLHFGARFDESLWSYVDSVMAGSEQPDIIVVTGDLVDTPSFFMLGLARRQLLQMQQKWCEGGRQCELVVIPGNHDVGIFGNLALWPWSSKFSIVFAPQPHAVLDRLPTYCTYRSWKGYKRWAVRGWWSVRFAVLRFFGRLRAPAAREPVQDCADQRICFACIDSNSDLALASGRVEHASILRIDSGLLKRRYPGAAGVLLNLVPRIALVHHHVVPIPYAGAVESLTEFEPFLVLRNAGTLLRELCEWDFDLILHGHKHFLNFARLTFDSADLAEKEVAVLAAGSATARQSGAGRNSFNLIKAYPSGCIWFRSVRYGQGQTAQMAAAWDTGFQRLLGLGKLKRRVHNRASAGLQICCDLKEHNYRVDEDGSADVSVRVVGLRGTDDEKVRRRREGFSVGFGAIDPASIRLDEESLNAGHRIENVPELPERSVHFDVLLGGARMGRDEGADYRFDCRLMNTFAVTRWECRAMGQPGERDWVAACVRVPTKKLRLSVQLPPSLQRPEPHVVVERYPGFPLLAVSPCGELDLSPNHRTWERDADFTHLEQAQLRRVSDRWVLDVDYPLVGHRYQIRWNVDSPTLPTTTQRQCTALQLRRSLVELREPRSEPARAIATHASEMLRMVTEQILRPLIGSEYALHECLEAALFVYDDERRSLRVVASFAPDGPGIVLEELPLNAGVGGAAFKSRRAQVYVCPQCSGKGGVYVYYPSSVPKPERTKFAALIALPLYLGDPAAVEEQANGDLRVAPEELIGVFTVGSTAFDSKLVTLGAEMGAEAASQQLTDTIWSVASQYLGGLSDEIRKAGTPD